MKDIVFIPILLFLIVFAFMGLCIYLWVYRETLLYKVLGNLELAQSEIKINKLSDYLMEEGGVKCSKIYKFESGLLFIVGFHIAGTFRKKFYLVLTFPDDRNNPGLYGGGHIYREMKHRRNDITFHRKSNFKKNSCYGDAVSDFEIVEVIGGNAFYYYPIPSMFGTGNLKRITKS